MEKEIKALIYKSLYWIIGLFTLIFALSILLKEPVVRLSSAFVDYFGIYGVGFGVAMSDALPGIMIPDAFLVFGIAGKLPDVSVILACGIGSVLGGSVSYLEGRYIVPSLNFGKAFIEKHEEKLLPMLEKYGVWAVVLAAATPMPYSWMAILVGSFKMSFYKFFLASLTRIPRFVVYFYAIKLGWVHGL
jgi:membrane protein YqaA with SNARE-associated domain